MFKKNTLSVKSLIVLFQNTAMLSFRPAHKERPVSCTLLSLEVFSCSLAAEEETALSIIDPMTVTIELNGSSNTLMTSSHSRGAHASAAGVAGATAPSSLSQRGLLDATSDKPPVLEVSNWPSYITMYIYICIFMPKKM